MVPCYLVPFVFLSSSRPPTTNPQLSSRKSCSRDYSLGMYFCIIPWLVWQPCVILLPFTLAAHGKKPAPSSLVQSAVTTNNCDPIKSFTTERYLQQHFAPLPPPRQHQKWSKCKNRDETVSIDKQVHASHCHAKPLPTSRHAALRSQTPSSPPGLKKKTYAGFEPKSSHPLMVHSITQHNTTQGNHEFAKDWTLCFW